MEKQITDLSVVELKALLFDLDQQSKQIQQNMSAVGQVLAEKMKQEQVAPETKPEEKPESTKAKK